MFPGVFPGVFPRVFPGVFSRVFSRVFQDSSDESLQQEDRTWYFSALYWRLLLRKADIEFAYMEKTEKRLELGI